jgi:hypothetical protein
MTEIEAEALKRDIIVRTKVIIREFGRYCTEGSNTICKDTKTFIKELASFCNDEDGLCYYWNAEKGQAAWPYISFIKKIANGAAGLFEDIQAKSDGKEDKTGENVLQLYLELHSKELDHDGSFSSIENIMGRIEDDRKKYEATQADERINIWCDTIDDRKSANEDLKKGIKVASNIKRRYSIANEIRNRVESGLEKTEFEVKDGYVKLSCGGFSPIRLLLTEYTKGDKQEMYKVQAKDKTTGWHTYSQEMQKHVLRAIKSGKEQVTEPILGRVIRVQITRAARRRRLPSNNREFDAEKHIPDFAERFAALSPLEKELYHLHHRRMAEGRRLTEADIPRSYTDTAEQVIARKWLIQGDRTPATLAGLMDQIVDAQVRDRRLRR